MNSSPGTPIGAGSPAASRTKARVFAIGRPMSATARSDSAGAVSDQTVVSVGPYMFSIVARVARRRSATSGPGSASPPIWRCVRPDRAARVSALSRSIRAILGVH